MIPFILFSGGLSVLAFWAMLGVLFPFPGFVAIATVGTVLLGGLFWYLVDV
jgi:hypothetical protein